MTAKYNVQVDCDVIELLNCAAVLRLFYISYVIHVVGNITRTGTLALQNRTRKSVTAVSVTSYLHKCFHKFVCLKICCILYFVGECTFAKPFFILGLI